VNHLEVAALRQRLAQMRGEIRQLRSGKAKLRTLLRRSLTTMTTVAEGMGERLPELDIFLAHVREVLEHSEDEDRNTFTHPVYGARRPRP
jgi:hypothetical protein